MTDTKLLIVMTAAVTLGGVGIWQNQRNYEAITNDRAYQEALMTTMTSSWTSGGIVRTVTTTRRDGESAEDFAARHRDEVEAMLALFPKDP